MESKVFMIIGKSFSGKDTALNNILLDEKFCKENNLYRLVRATTRYPRPYEVEGKDYYFITDKDYKEHYKNRDDVIISSYASEFGVLDYITDFSRLDPNKNYIVVSDTESIPDYKRILGDRLCIIYLVPPNWEIFRRFSSRDDNSEYSDLKYKEIYRRFIDDTIKFGKHSNEYTANCNCITVIGKDINLELLKETIGQFIHEDWRYAGVLIHDKTSVLYCNSYVPKNNVAHAQIFKDGIILLHNSIIIYTEKESYEFTKDDYVHIDWEYISDNLANAYATEKVRREFEQGFQGWEYKFNTVASSRGDYPFIAISFGVGTSKWESMASEMALRVRMKGQGKKGFKRPVLFPKLTFLYDENLHGEGKDLEWLFDVAIECSSKSMYPDFLSLTGKGYIPSMYKKYGKVISLMGCRASLSPWYERGGMHPADENDVPIFEGRFNLGAISLHLPMILAKARQENKDFYEVLMYYLELIRNLHKRTYAFLGEKKASTNPLGFTQGGFLGGTLKPDEKIKSILPPMTMSFGITALNELQRLYNGKSITEDGSFALEVMQYINDYVNRIKVEDNILYAIYGTPAESLCGLQVEQFRKKYGIIENVSDKAYVSNSFHCHVSEDITPIEKQDLEDRFWNLFNGGKIQYCRYPIDYNKTAIKTLIRRAMDKGFYEGVNLSLAYCEDCGYQQLEMDTCPKCGSSMITKIDRMNGYLGYSRVHGKSRYNASKMDEIADRKSM